MQPQQTEQQTGWNYVQNNGDQQNMQSSSQYQAAPQSNISWSASEFVSYQKGASWYVGILTVVMIVAAIIVLITSDFISAGVTILVGILFLVFASRKPRVLTYAISSSGIQVGEKQYSFSELRSFAVIDEGSLRSIMLLPTQRFKPAVSIYYEPNEEQKIIDTLGSYLPHEERKQELIDRFMHKIRF